MQTWLLRNPGASVDTEDVVCISGEGGTVALRVFPFLVTEGHFELVGWDRMLVDKIHGERKCNNCKRQAPPSGFSPREPLK
jgi:hypothetical protein